MSERPYTTLSLESCLARIAVAEDLPTFANHLAELQATATDTDASVRRLTNVILKNVSLTAKVLRAVNSVYFNRTGKSILSVSHAVTLLGWNAIHDLATSLLLFEHFGKRSSGIGEQILLSLLTANHARQLAIQIGYPRAEEAYLCGMFRGLGELLVACYLQKQHGEILEVMGRESLSEREACRRVLSFTYEDLAKGMCRQWNLPKKVASCMDKLPSLSAAAETDAERLHLITTLSHELSDAVYRQDPSKGRQKVLAFLKQYGKTLSLNEASLDKILKAAVAETWDTFAAADIRLDNLRLVKQINRVLHEEKQPEQPKAALSEPAKPVTSDGETLVQLTREVEAILDSDEVFELNDILLMVIEAIYRGGKFDRVLLCLVSRDRSFLLARMGLGEGSDTLMQRFRFPISLLSGPVGPAMIKHRDVFVESVSLSRYAQSAFEETVGAYSFGMLPMIVSGISIGCLYFDRINEVLGLHESMEQALCNLRDYASSAIAGRQGESNR